MESVMTIGNTQKTSLVPALDRAFEILDCVTVSTHALTAADIAKKLNLPRSSVYNILHSLCQKGVLFKDAENRFYIGSYVMYWAGKFEEQQGVIKIFQEIINQYNNLLDYTITLSTLDSQTGEVVFLDCRTPQLPLGFNFRAGVRVPAVFSATGKAMLSTWLSDDIKMMYGDSLPPALTPFSVQNYDRLFEELNSVKQTRVSLDDGQLREGMFCIGTYIRDKSGSAIAGIAVSLLKHEYQTKRMEVEETIIVIAKDIEKRLGLKS